MDIHKNLEINGNAVVDNPSTVTELCPQPLETIPVKVTEGDTPEAETSNDNEAYKKIGRRVTFPEDIVLAYHDHPCPWKNASSCTPEILTEAYKQACMKFEVKPLPKVLQQLAAIANFHDRNETLTLRSERVDNRHCETLEEILRRVQFRTIDLEATHLDDESAIALFDMIEYYRSATRVNISYNKLGVRGWQSCARMLKKTSCIEQLDARCCTIVDQVMPFFGRAIRLGSQVAVLHLENSVASGRPLMILVAAVKTNEPLRELYLADNKLMPPDGIQLGSLLKFNHKLRLLDLRNNNLGDVGCERIFEGLAEQSFGVGLQTLVLWNNQLTCNIMASLSKALRLTQTLETINLGHNNITNEGVHRLKEALLFNKSLLRIGLQASKLSCEGAIALAECIAESSKLLRLDLRENDIKTGGLMALSLALKVNQSVTRIDLDQKTKKESSVRDYAEQQQRLLADIAEYSQRNRVAGLQREEEEKQRRVEEELQRAMQEGEEDTVCHSGDEDEVIEATEIQEVYSPCESNTAQQETSVYAVQVNANVAQQTTPTSSPQPVQSTDDPVVSNDVDSNPENATSPVSASSNGSQQSRSKNSRLSLNLASVNTVVIPRCQTLESPADCPASVSYPSVDVPAAIPEEVVSQSKFQFDGESGLNLGCDLPPSPMVTSEGKTILAVALAESEKITSMEPNASGILSVVVNECPKAPVVSAPLTIKISNPLETQIKRSSSPKHPNSSPNSRFTIKRVIEKKSTKTSASLAAHTDTQSAAPIDASLSMPTDTTSTCQTIVSAVQVSENGTSQEIDSSSKGLGELHQPTSVGTGESSTDANRLAVNEPCKAMHFLQSGADNAPLEIIESSPAIDCDKIDLHFVNEESVTDEVNSSTDAVENSSASELHLNEQTSQLLSNQCSSDSVVHIASDDFTGNQSTDEIKLFDNSNDSDKDTELEQSCNTDILDIKIKLCENTNDNGKDSELEQSCTTYVVSNKREDNSNTFSSSTELLPLKPNQDEGSIVSCEIQQIKCDVDDTMKSSRQQNPDCNATADVSLTGENENTEKNYLCAVQNDVNLVYNNEETVSNPTQNCDKSSDLTKEHVETNGYDSASLEDVQSSNSEPLNSDTTNRCEYEQRTESKTGFGDDLAATESHGCEPDMPLTGEACQEKELSTPEPDIPLQVEPCSDKELTVTDAECPLRGGACEEKGPSKANKIEELAMQMQSMNGVSMELRNAVGDSADSTSLQSTDGTDEDQYEKEDDFQQELDDLLRLSFSEQVKVE